ncbi:EamA family transporter [Nucisporomicrobium flavum]|uniref:EamA family transporter n=1 Tax=Nucisporomicrobium flavum TaxID=2785915 RepID=UPI003C2FF459
MRISALLVVYVVWGSTYVAMKVGVERMPPLAMNAVRFFVAGALLWCWCAWRRRGGRWHRPTAAQWRAGAVQGLLLPAAGTGGATWAEQKLPAGTTALLLATIPLWMALGKRVADGERIGWTGIAGIVAGFGGVALLTGTGERPDPLATAVALGGALCWGLGSVYATRAPQPEQPLLASSVEMLCAGGILAVAAAVGGEFGRFEAPGRSAWALAYLVLFGSLLAYSCYQYLLHHMPARIVGTYAFVNPVVAVLLGWWLLGEQVGGRTALATAVIVTGVALIVIPSRRGARGVEDDDETTDAADGGGRGGGPRGRRGLRTEQVRR